MLEVSIVNSYPLPPIMVLVSFEVNDVGSPPVILDVSIVKL
jgi:hypothetical protein